MKYILILIIVTINISCGSLNSSLQSGLASYPTGQQIPKSATAKKSIKKSFFTASASGCFANSSESVDLKIITPAINELIAKNHAIAAQNVRATRSIGPTVIDIITFGWIWGCSYWDISGEMIFL